MEYGCRPIGVTIEELINQLREARAERDATATELAKISSQLEMVTTAREQYDDEQSRQQALMTKLEQDIRAAQDSVKKWLKAQQKERTRIAKLGPKIAKGGLEERDAIQEQQNAKQTIAVYDSQIAGAQQIISNNTAALDVAEKARNSAKSFFEQAKQQAILLSDAVKALEKNLKQINKNITSLQTKLETKRAAEPSSSSSSSAKRNATIADLPPPVAKRGDEALRTAFYRRVGIDPALQAAYDALMAQTGPGSLTLARLVGNVAYMYDTEGLRMGIPPVMRTAGLPDNVPAVENAVRETTRQAVGTQFVTMLSAIRDHPSVSSSVRQMADLYMYGILGLLHTPPDANTFTAPKPSNTSQHIAWTYDPRGIVYPTSDGPSGRDQSFTGLVEAMLIYVLTAQ